MTGMALRPLPGIRLADAPQVGGKAANLGQLLSMGVRVPEGFVVANCGTGVSEDDQNAIVEAVGELGDGPLAVRSSAVGEDSAQHSFAGLFTSVLHVHPTDVLAAVGQVLASAHDQRVADYGDASRQVDMAVVVQRMIQPAVSGVALTADPIDGNRRTCVVTAVQGTGDRLVSGESMGDEWAVVEGDKPVQRRRADGVLDGRTAELVASTAREIAKVRGAPQDIEWAIDLEGDLWILQARPMTALPAEVSWDPPSPGAFSRTFRLGEWISGPVTPLFESWLLPVMEDTLHATLQQWTGLRSPQPHMWWLTGGVSSR